MSTSLLLDRRVPATAASVPLIRHQILAVLSEQPAVSRQMLEAVALAVTEAVANTARHAYADDHGDVEVKVARTGSRITITVADTGQGMPGPAPRTGSGLGLGLIAALATDSTLTSDSTGTTVTMHFDMPLTLVPPPTEA